MGKEINYPIRINKYLSYNDVCSRRQADRFVEDGKVFVNGQPAELGQKVQKEDIVTLADDIQDHEEHFVYFAFYKPKGVVSVNPQRDEEGVADYFDPKEDVSPVGRLDKDSEGLLFLTNDGRIVHEMLHPDKAHEKAYTVQVNKPIDGIFKDNMESGVDIEGYTTKPATVHILDDHTFRIILTEGKHHQIRRMTAALGYAVESLKRTRIMNIELGDLPPGAAREITEDELDTLFAHINVERSAKKENGK